MPIVRFAAVFVFAGLITVPAAAKDVSASECNALFNRVDRNDDGVIGRSENVQFYLNRITLGESNKVDDYIMQKSTFVWHCQRGMFPVAQS
jgi:hypothetical protein